MQEREIQHNIRLALGTDPRVVLWRNSVGVAETGGRKQRFGLAVGSSDLIGVLRPSGRFIAMEIKTMIGRLSPEQQQYLQLIRQAGGFACVVRSVADARDAIDRASAGACE